MRHAPSTLLMLSALLAAALPATAQDRRDSRSQREDAGARVRQLERAGGRVLQAEPMQRGGEEVYRIKVLTPEGRVRVISADDDRGGARPRPRQDVRPDLTERRREFRNDGGADFARDRPERHDADRRERAREVPREREDRGGRGRRGD